jgi:D-serine dehydratase
MNPATIDLSTVGAILVDERIKGLPGGSGPIRLDAIGLCGWNLLRGDLPLPVALLKQTALTQNSAWMRRFVAHTDVMLAPHGKTTMSPQLFAQQLQDGAWGITLATVAQVQVARACGLSRVFFANQLVGRAEMRYIFSELTRDPGFDFYCLVDSASAVRTLASAAAAARIGRPVQVLVERGVMGRRAGARTSAEGMAVARAVHAEAPWLALCGIEGFEGVVGGDDTAERERGVRIFLESIVETARQCAAENLFAPGPVILTAGGSAFFDLAVEVLHSANLGQETLVLLRSGCYLTQDAQQYERAFARILERSGAARALGDRLINALELWAYVVSRPEPTRVILGFGKRDASYDDTLPRPLFWFRPGTHERPLAVGVGSTIVALNDQHALMDVSADSPLAVGDMVGLGISHPCTTFDKWQLLPVVADDYSVIDAVKTFF